jgi:hypothetical protein
MHSEGGVDVLLDFELLNLLLAFQSGPLLLSSSCSCLPCARRVGCLNWAQNASV